MNNVINLVRCLPDEVFVEPQLSSPHLASAQQSTDSLDADGAAPPPERDGGARYNIVRELVETERKYVQDLEVMQVSLPMCLRLILVLTHAVPEIFHCGVANECDGSRDPPASVPGLEQAS